MISNHRANISKGIFISISMPFLCGQNMLSYNLCPSPFGDDKILSSGSVIKLSVLMIWLHGVQSIGGPGENRGGPILAVRLLYLTKKHALRYKRRLSEN